MREAGFDRHVGPENICENIMVALRRAEAIHREEVFAAARPPES